MGVICAPRGEENDVEWLEDSLQPLRPFQISGNSRKWGNNGDESGHDEIGLGLKEVWITQSYPVLTCRGM